MEKEGLVEGCEMVYSITGWYDGPLTGVVEYRGTPHAFESTARDFDAEGETFYLKPISQETFTLHMEQWNLFLKWLEAFYDKKVQIDKNRPPALPEDRDRYLELEHLLKDVLKVEDDKKAVRGMMIPRKVSQEKNYFINGSAAPWQVKWAN